MNVTSLHTRTNIDQLWERYAAIAREAIEDPRIMLNRERSQELAGAWEDWRDAYLRGRK